MDVKIMLRNRQWLDSKQEQYPFACHTKVEYPRPEEVGRRLPDLDLIGAPLMRLREWRFPDEVSMNLFKREFATVDNKSTFV